MRDEDRERDRETEREREREGSKEHKLANTKGFKILTKS